MYKFYKTFFVELNILIRKNVYTFKVKKIIKKNNTEIEVKTTVRNNLFSKQQKIKIHYY